MQCSGTYQHGVLNNAMSRCLNIMGCLITRFYHDHCSKLENCGHALRLLTCVIVTDPLHRVESKFTIVETEWPEGFSGEVPVAPAPLWAGAVDCLT